MSDQDPRTAALTTLIVRLAAKDHEQSHKLCAGLPGTNGDPSEELARGIRAGLRTAIAEAQNLLGPATDEEAS